MTDAESAAINWMRAAGNKPQLRIQRTLWIIKNYYSLRF